MKFTKTLLFQLVTFLMSCLPFSVNSQTITNERIIADIAKAAYDHFSPTIK